MGVLGSIGRRNLGLYKAGLLDKEVTRLAGNQQIKKIPPDGNVSEVAEELGIIDRMRGTKNLYKEGIDDYISQNKKVAERLGVENDLEYSNWTRAKAVFLNEDGSINKTYAGIAGTGVLGGGYTVLSDSKSGIPRI